MENVQIPAQRIRYSASDRAEICRRVDECIASGQIAAGKNIVEFESQFAEYTRAKHAIAVSSGGSALEIAIQLLGLDGGEVIIPTNTFVASAVPVLMNGGVVRLVDIDRNSLGLTLKNVVDATTSKTVGVVLVHIGGIISPDTPKIAAYCREKGFWLIEDCAHAHGSTLDGISAGQFGSIGVYSFFSTKVVTCGEGGMIITNCEESATKARLLRDYGKPEPWTSYSVVVGGNRRMSEISAAFGNVSMSKCAENVAARRRVLNLYEKFQSDLFGFEFINASHPTSGYKCIGLLPRGMERNLVKSEMQNKGVQLAGGVYEIPLHRQPIFEKSGAYCPVADDVCDRHICLPIYPDLRDDEVEYVVKSLRDVIASMQLRHV